MIIIAVQPTIIILASHYSKTKETPLCSSSGVQHSIGLWQYTQNYSEQLFHTITTTQ